MIGRNYAGPNAAGAQRTERPYYARNEAGAPRLTDPGPYAAGSVPITQTDATTFTGFETVWIAADDGQFYPVKLVNADGFVGLGVGQEPAPATPLSIPFIPLTLDGKTHLLTAVNDEGLITLGVEQDPSDMVGLPYFLLRLGRYFYQIALVNLEGTITVAVYQHPF